MARYSTRSEPASSGTRSVSTIPAWSPVMPAGPRSAPGTGARSAMPVENASMVLPWGASIAPKKGQAPRDAGGPMRVPPS